MWMCTSAGTMSGGPNFDFATAWTQKDLSDAPDGFGLPDDSGYCFIGFADQAPMISQNSFGSEYTQLAYTFIEYFYEAATSGYSVHDSLNLASEAVFGGPYVYSPLYKDTMRVGRAVTWAIPTINQDMILWAKCGCLATQIYIFAQGTG